jgi:DNA-binding transcriptional regulator GbsR (MarR family)
MRVFGSVPPRGCAARSSRPSPVRRGRSRIRRTKQLRYQCRIRFEQSLDTRLQGWGIVKLVHVLGDKRDHFESMKDVWEMFRIVLDERKKREFDPTTRMLHECIVEAEKDKATDEYTEDRLRELYTVFETTTALYVQVRRWPTAAMFKFMKTGDKVLKVLGIA